MALTDTLPAHLKACLDARLPRKRSPVSRRRRVACQRVELLRKRTLRALSHNNRVQSVLEQNSWKKENTKREYYNPTQPRKIVKRDHEENRRQLEAAKSIKLLRHNNSVLTAQTKAKWAFRRKLLEMTAQMKKPAHRSADAKKAHAKMFNDKVATVRKRLSSVKDSRRQDIVAKVMALSDFLPPKTRRRLDTMHKNKKSCGNRRAVLRRQLRDSQKSADARRKEALLKRALDASHHNNKVKAVTARRVWGVRNRQRDMRSAMDLRFSLADLSRQNARLKQTLNVRIHNNTRVAEAQLLRAAKALQFVQHAYDSHQHRHDRADFTIRGRQVLC